MITRYDPECDDLVSVDQAWCDAVQHNVNLLAMQREILRSISSMNTVVHEEDLKSIWNYIRSLGLAKTVAESMDERKRSQEISKKISAGLNAALGFGQ